MTTLFDLWSVNVTDDNSNNVGIAAPSGFSLRLAVGSLVHSCGARRLGKFRPNFQRR